MENKAKRKWAVQNDFRLFFHYYFAHYLKFDTAPFQDEIYNDLQNWSIKYEEIIAFRESAKSTFVMLGLPIWAVISNKAKFPLLIADTGLQAKQHIYNLKSELENNQLLINDWGPFQENEEWTTTNIVLPRYDARIIARSTGQKIRGLRHKQYRPDLACHEKGTMMFEDGKWFPVEEHKSFTKYRKCDGLSISIHGTPFSENVTKDHRYWIREVNFKTSKRDNVLVNEPGWKKAEDILNESGVKSFIGYPINNTIGTFQPLDVYKPGIILERSKDGRIIDAGGRYEKEVPNEFYDTEWWWLLGLWWGDGTLPGGKDYAIILTIANKDTKTFNRVKKILKDWNKPYSISEGDGCFNLKFNKAQIARWLRTWKYGNSRKIPPYWVEQLPLRYQKALIQGYVQADGYFDKKNECVRITSVCLDGLLCVKRILARIGIPSSIRNGIDGVDDYEIMGHKCKTQKKYDIRFRENASILEYDIKNQTRYALPSIFIKDGFMWSKIKSIESIENRNFVPLNTIKHKYITYFGLSHNCFDDLENIESIRTIEQRDKNERWLLDEAIPALDDNAKKVIIGNLLHSDSLMMRIKKQIINKEIDAVLREYPIIKGDKIFWKSKYPNMEAIEKKRKSTRNPSGSPWRTWNREYLLNIVPEEGQTIKEDWIKYYDKLPEGDIMQQGTGVDLAISKKDTADYTAMVSGRLYEVEGDTKLFIMPNPVNARLTGFETTDTARNVSLALGNGSTTQLWVEDVAYQRMQIEAMTKIGLPAMAVRVTSDKRSRLSMAGSYVQIGKVLFPRKGCEDLITQLLGFGIEINDDLVDGFTILVNKIFESQVNIRFI